MTPPGQGDSGAADPRLRAALEAGDETALAAALDGARVFVGVESRLLELAPDATHDPAATAAATAARTPRDAAADVGGRPSRGSGNVAGPLPAADSAAPAAGRPLDGRRPGEAARRKPGIRGDKRSEMVLATLRLPSGATALPVFSSAAALSAWRASARPVPVSARDACAQAAQLGHRAVVIDVAGPVTATLDVSTLAAAQVGPRAGATPSDVPPRAAAEAPVALEGPSAMEAPAALEGPDLSENSAVPASPGRAEGRPETEDAAVPAAGRGAESAAGGGAVPSEARVAGLRRPSRPWDRARRLRVTAELGALAAAGLVPGAQLWPADLVAPRPAGGEVTVGEALAVALPASVRDDDLRLDEVASRLRAAATVAGAAPAVIFVAPAEAAGLSRSLGRGLAPRRWRRRSRLG
jgi:hypothetical protein